MTKIPRWPVTKYKQTGIKIAAAKQKSSKCLWKGAENAKPTALATQTAEETPQPKNPQGKKKRKNNSRAQDDKIIVSPYADDALPFYRA